MRMAIGKMAEGNRYVAIDMNRDSKESKRNSKKDSKRDS